MKFKGDIIITDPCYIVRAEHHGTKPLTDNDWKACGYGSNMEVFGIKNYFTESTIYGDWSCTTFELKDDKWVIEKTPTEITSDDIKGILGNFCADAGLVSVFLLEEVLKYNPNYNDHIKNPFTTTLIKDFDGDVDYIVEDDEAFIKGTGNINFITRQTGF